MAPITKTLALAGAFFAVSGFAAPFNKRAVVWETVTDIVWETVDVTTTIYPGHGQQAQTTVVPVVTSTSVEATPTAQAAASAQTLDEEEATTTSTTAVAAPTTTAQATTTAAPVVQAAAESSSSSTSSTSSAASTTSSASSSSSTGSSSASSSGYSGSCSSGSPCTGDITYYDTSTSASNPSACGTTNDGLTELVLALPNGIMTDSDCGKSVTVKYNGVSKTGTVVDRCMGCDNESIDLSRAFFEAVAGSLDAGRISGVEWYIN